MVTAINKFPDPKSDSDDSDTPSSPNSKSNVYQKLKHSEGNKFEPNNKCKCLSLKNKNNMQRI